MQTIKLWAVSALVLVFAVPAIGGPRSWFHSKHNAQPTTPHQRSNHYAPKHRAPKHSKPNRGKNPHH